MPAVPLLALAAALGPLTAQQEKPRPHRPHEPRRPAEKAENLIALPEGYVRFARVPDGGCDARVERHGDELVLLYFRGSAEGGDLFLARSPDEAASFAPALRIPAEPGAVGLCAGRHTGALDVAPDGTAHVVWYGRGERPSLFHARVPSAGEAAVTELGAPPGLACTPAVAVDREGGVHVFYAAREAGEEGRLRIWTRRGADGASFSEPVAIDREGEGVSPECALAAAGDDVVGSVYVMYRTAYLLKPDSKNFSRGMRLLTRDEHEESFHWGWVDNWRQPRDPRSTAGLCQDPNTTIAFWDAGGQVFWATIRRQMGKVNLPMEPRFDEPPAVRTLPAGAGAGEDVFLAWVERPKDEPDAPVRLRWRVWQRFSRMPLGDGFAPEPPGDGAPASFARKDGGYTVLY